MNENQSKSLNVRDGTQQICLYYTNKCYAIKQVNSYNWENFVSRIAEIWMDQKIKIENGIFCQTAGVQIETSYLLTYCWFHFSW